MLALMMLDLQQLRWIAILLPCDVVVQLQGNGSIGPICA
jgi:hypothetical protein